MGESTSAGGLQDGDGIHAAPGATAVSAGPLDEGGPESTPREWISGAPERAGESERNVPAAAPVEPMGSGSLGESVLPPEYEDPTLRPDQSRSTRYEPDVAAGDEPAVADGDPVREQGAGWGSGEAETGYGRESAAAEPASRNSQADQIETNERPTQAVTGDDGRAEPAPAGSWAESTPAESRPEPAPAGSTPAESPAEPDAPAAAGPLTSPTHARGETGHRSLSSQAPIQWERPEDPSDLTAATFSANAENHDQEDEDAARARDREADHLL